MPADQTTPPEMTPEQHKAQLYLAHGITQPPAPNQQLFAACRGIQCGGYRCGEPCCGDREIKPLAAAIALSDPRDAEITRLRARIAELEAARG